MRSGLGICVIVVALFVLVSGPANANITLGPVNGWYVDINTSTGQMIGIRNAANWIVQSSQDVYELGAPNPYPNSLGTTVTNESNDQVQAWNYVIQGEKVAFSCTNSVLSNITICKGYWLKSDPSGNGYFDLVKTVYLTTSDSSRRLVKVGSETKLQNDRYVYNDPACAWYDSNYPKTYYYVPMDDGYKAYEYAGLVKSPNYHGPLFTLSDLGANNPWGTGYGRFVYHVPYYNDVFTHYRSRVSVNGNWSGMDMVGGQYPYSLYWVDDFCKPAPQPDGYYHQNVSKWIERGAVTFLGQEFLSSNRNLGIESVYTIIPGNVKNYHKYVMSHSPYKDYAVGGGYYSDYQVPPWMKNTRLYGGVNWMAANLVESSQTLGYVTAELGRFQSLLTRDQYVMPLFIYWGLTGDYPADSDDTNTVGVTRQDWNAPYKYRNYWNPTNADPTQCQVGVYHTYANYDLTDALSEVKDVCASGQLTGHVKPGGYVFAEPNWATWPYQNHYSDWFVYQLGGGLMKLWDGLGDWANDEFSRDAYPDFSLPNAYTAYETSNFQGCLGDIGWDWLHIDYQMGECPNYNPSNYHVIQPADSATINQALGHYVSDYPNKGMIRNGGPECAWWAPGSMWEPVDTKLDVLEQHNWRLLANFGYLAGLYRTNRPGVWTTLVYGASGLFGQRNAMSGLKGWTRGVDNYYDHLWQALGYEKIADEMLQTKVSDVQVTSRPTTATPRTSWWAEPQNNNMNFEAEAYQTGDNTLIVSMLQHVSASSQLITYSIPNYNSSNVTFGYDLKVTLDDISAYNSLPWSQDYIQLTKATVTGYPVTSLTDDYSMGNLNVLRNYYHVATQVPAFIYAINNGAVYKRASLPLTYFTPTLPASSGDSTPTTRQVSVAGSYPVSGASSYNLTVSNDTTYPVKIMAYVPQSWGTTVGVSGTGVTVDGMYNAPQASWRLLLLTVPSTTSAITVSSGGTNYASATYANPQENVWTEACNAAMNSFSGTYQIGPSFNGIYLTGTGSAWAYLQYKPFATATGISLDVWRNDVDDTVRVYLYDSTGASHYYDISDAYISQWKHYNINLSQMTPSVSSATITAYGLYSFGASAPHYWNCFKDIKLIP